MSTIPNEHWNQLDKLLASLMNIHDLSASCGGNASLAALCDSILDNACRLTGSCRGSMMLLNERDQELKIIASKGISPILLDRVRLKPGEGIAGMAFFSGKSIVVQNPQNNRNYVDYLGQPEQQEPFISIPIKTKDKIIGVMNLHVEDTAIASDYTLKLLAVLAGKAAITIENIRLNDNLQNFYLEMVETLARVIDAKDSYTHDHAGRARKKARRIAEKMSLDTEAIREIEYAALLHDIGKIGISEAILSKPGRLTDEEYQEIKRHPVIGYQILSPVPFLNQVAGMVLHHQEWYNGKGYPEGLRGDAIPLGARIVSAIDAWDAMNSDRPYRKALPRASALQELKKGRGTQFDPNVIDIFLSLTKTEWKDEPEYSVSRK